MKRPAALLIIDMISDFDFPRGDALARRALPVALRIARLRNRLRRRHVPVIYANDHHGRWRSDFREMVARCGAPGGRGAEITAALAPRPDDYFVLKPRHSAFYGTPLEMLLAELEVGTLVLTGVAGDRCVTATASDAHMRKFDCFAPSDCIACETQVRQTRTLKHLAAALQVDTRDSAGLTPRRLRALR